MFLGRYLEEVTNHRPSNRPRWERTGALRKKHPYDKVNSYPEEADIDEICCVGHGRRVNTRG